jgi:hypothetical protein
MEERPERGRGLRLAVREGVRVDLFKATPLEIRYAARRILEPHKKGGAIAAGAAVHHRPQALRIAGLASHAFAARRTAA